MIDCIVNRHELKAKLFNILESLTGNDRIYHAPSELKILYGQSLGKMPQRLQELMTLSIVEEVGTYAKD